MPDLNRFKKAAMLLGGCKIVPKGPGKEDELQPRPGWVTYAADAFGTDKSNFSKILTGQRTLTTDLEVKMMQAIRRWRHAEIRRHSILATLQADYDHEFTKSGLFVAEPDYEDDGPAPSPGG